MLNEHHKLNKKGEIEGIYRVDTKKIRGLDLWAKLDAVIQTWAQIHPEEVVMQLKENLLTLEAQKNEYGSGQRFRFGISIPVGLLLDLERVEPKLFENKKLFNQFMERYKGFRVCRKV